MRMINNYFNNLYKSFKIKGTDMKFKIILIMLMSLLISCATIDKKGFNIDTKIHSKTKTPYDLYGYDMDGYYLDGYNKQGYNKEGFDRDGYYKDGYNINGYNRKGYNKEGFNRGGYNRAGYDRDGFDRDGFDKNGYSKIGYDRNGFDKNGIHIKTGKKYDKSGLDVDRHINLTNLRNRKTDSVSKIITNVKKLAKAKPVKGDFETQKEYDTRYNLWFEKNAKELDQFFVVNIQLKSFPFYETKLLHQKTQRTSGIGVSYDPEKEEFHININQVIKLNEIEVNKGQFIGSNAFGITKKIQKKYIYQDYLYLNSDGIPYSLPTYADYCTFSFHVPRAIAKSSKLTGQLIYKIRNVSIYQDGIGKLIEATISNPEESWFFYKIISALPLAFVAYDENRNVLNYSILKKDF